VGTELLAEIGLAPPQELVLMQLAERGDLPQSEIVHYLNRDRSTVTNTLQAMERAGLIVRWPSPTDRRAIVVSLTEQGHNLYPRARAIWLELERRTTRELSMKERDSLIQSLAAARKGLLLT
jgi:DNA-binding MarR family transcriptional regulator